MNTTSEERKHLFKIAVQSAFKNIFPGGDFINDIFEYRGKLKEKRVLDFFELVRTAVIETNPQVDINSINSEEIGDLFENILKKVSETRQIQKILGFRNLMINGIASKNSIDYCEIFSNILMQLHEKQIEILLNYSEKINKKGFSLLRKHELNEQLFNIQSEIRKNELADNKALIEKEQELIKQIELIKIGLENNENIREASYYNLTESEFKYFVHDLYNKALLNDEGVGAINTLPFQIMNVTDFGNKFLEFILNPLQAQD